MAFNKEQAFEAYLIILRQISLLTPYQQMLNTPGKITDFLEIIYKQGHEDAMKERQIKITKNN